MGLSSLITECRFVLTMLLLFDALPHITYLSKAFQVTDCDYSIISPMLSAALQSLNQLKVCDGVNLD